MDWNENGIIASFIHQGKQLGFQRHSSDDLSLLRVWEGSGKERKIIKIRRERKKYIIDKEQIARGEVSFKQEIYISNSLTRKHNLMRLEESEAYLYRKGICINRGEEKRETL